MNDKIQFELRRSEALVLFELLAKYEEGADLDTTSPSAKLALLRLQGALERTMVELFNPEYQELLQQAQKDLAMQYESK